jgi:hypothetical protein
MNAAIYMRIQESEYRMQKKNNTMVILAPAFPCFVVPTPGIVVNWYIIETTATEQERD